MASYRLRFDDPLRRCTSDHRARTPLGAAFVSATSDASFLFPIDWQHLDARQRGQVMALTPGARLGPYEIVSPAGAGGMGEVYRARDTRLDRTVALKVLPPDLTNDPAARQRFEREARAVAALSHPHICTLHDIGQQDGTDFLVMEYLDGETLAARLARGKLPLDQALHYGIQIADALAAAHKAGIVHRDLKPGNVMLTKSGAKLLDFGLAKPGVQIAGSGITQLATAGTADRRGDAPGHAALHGAGATARGRG